MNNRRRTRGGNIQTVFVPLMKAEKKSDGTVVFYPNTHEKAGSTITIRHMPKISH